MAKPEVKACHFHGAMRNGSYPGTHIMQITHVACGGHKVVYTCDECTKSVRTYEEGNSDLTVVCAFCKKPVVVKEHWIIIGAA